MRPDRQSNSPASADPAEAEPSAPPAPEAARAIAALRRYFASLPDERAGATSAAKDVVCELVRRRRDEGRRPESVVVEVKALVHEAGGRLLPRPLLQGTLDDAVRWCISEYYK